MDPNCVLEANIAVYEKKLAETQGQFNSTLKPAAVTLKDNQADFAKKINMVTSLHQICVLEMETIKEKTKDPQQEEKFQTLKARLIKAQAEQDNDSPNYNKVNKAALI